MLIHSLSHWCDNDIDFQENPIWFLFLKGGYQKCKDFNDLVLIESSNNSSTPSNGESFARLSIRMKEIFHYFYVPNFISGYNHLAVDADRDTCSLHMEAQFDLILKYLNNDIIQIIGGAVGNKVAESIDSRICPTDCQCWSWITHYERATMKIINAYFNRDLRALSDALVIHPYAMWSILQRHEYYNIVHMCVLDNYVGGLSLILSQLHNYAYDTKLEYSDLVNGGEGLQNSYIAFKNDNNPVNQTDRYGDSPLLMASRLFRLPLVEQLLKIGDATQDAGDDHLVNSIRLSADVLLVNRNQRHCLHELLIAFKKYQCCSRRNAPPSYPAMDTFQPNQPAQSTYADTLYKAATYVNYLPEHDAGVNFSVSQAVLELLRLMDLMLLQVSTRPNADSECIATFLMMQDVHGFNCIDYAVSTQNPTIIDYVFRHVYASVVTTKTDVLKYSGTAAATEEVEKLSLKLLEDWSDYIRHLILLTPGDESNAGARACLHIPFSHLFKDHVVYQAVVKELKTRQEHPKEATPTIQILLRYLGMCIRDGKTCVKSLTVLLQMEPFIAVINCRLLDTSASTSVCGSSSLLEMAVRLEDRTSQDEDQSSICAYSNYKGFLHRNCKRLLEDQRRTSGGTSKRSVETVEHRVLNIIRLLLVSGIDPMLEGCSCGRAICSDNIFGLCASRGYLECIKVLVLHCEKAHQVFHSASDASWNLRSTSEMNASNALQCFYPVDSERQTQLLSSNTGYTLCSAVTTSRVVSTFKTNPIISAILYASITCGLVEVLANGIKAIESIKCDALRCLEYLLEYSPFRTLLNYIDAEGNTPLLVACQCKNAEIIEFLLQKGATPWMAIPLVRRMEASGVPHPISTSDTSQLVTNPHGELLVAVNLLRRLESQETLDVNMDPGEIDASKNSMQSVSMHCSSMLELVENFDMCVHRYEEQQKRKDQQGQVRQTAPQGYSNSSLGSAKGIRHVLPSKEVEEFFCLLRMGNGSGEPKCKSGLPGFLPPRAAAQTNAVLGISHVDVERAAMNPSSYLDILRQLMKALVEEVALFDANPIEWWLRVWMKHGDNCVLHCMPKHVGACQSKPVSSYGGSYTPDVLDNLFLSSGVFEFIYKRGNSDIDGAVMNAGGAGAGEINGTPIHNLLLEYAQSVQTPGAAIDWPRPGAHISLNTLIEMGFKSIVQLHRMLLQLSSGTSQPCGIEDPSGSIDAPNYLNCTTVRSAIVSISISALDKHVQNLLRAVLSGIATGTEREAVMDVIGGDFFPENSMRIQAQHTIFACFGLLLPSPLSMFFDMGEICCLCPSLGLYNKFSALTCNRKTSCTLPFHGNNRIHSSFTASEVNSLKRVWDNQFVHSSRIWRLLSSSASNCGSSDIAVNSCVVPKAIMPSALLLSPPSASPSAYPSQMAMGWWWDILRCTADWNLLLAVITSGDIYCDPSGQLVGTSTQSVHHKASDPGKHHGAGQHSHPTHTEYICVSNNFVLLDDEWCVNAFIKECVRLSPPIEFLLHLLHHVAQMGHMYFECKSRNPYCGRDSKPIASDPRVGYSILSRDTLIVLLRYSIEHTSLKLLMTLLLLFPYADGIAGSDVSVGDRNVKLGIEFWRGLHKQHSNRRLYNQLYGHEMELENNNALPHRVIFPGIRCKTRSRWVVDRALETESSAINDVLLLIIKIENGYHVYTGGNPLEPVKTRYDYDGLLYPLASFPRKAPSDLLLGSLASGKCSGSCSGATSCPFDTSLRSNCAHTSYIAQCSSSVSTGNFSDSCVSSSSIFLLDRFLHCIFKTCSRTVTNTVLEILEGYAGGRGGKNGLLLHSNYGNALLSAIKGGNESAVQQIVEAVATPGSDADIKLHQRFRCTACSAAVDGTLVRPIAVQGKCASSGANGKTDGFGYDILVGKLLSNMKMSHRRCLIASELHIKALSNATVGYDDVPNHILPLVLKLCNSTLRLEKCLMLGIEEDLAEYCLVRCSICINKKPKKGLLNDEVHFPVCEMVMVFLRCVGLKSEAPPNGCNRGAKLKEFVWGLLSNPLDVCFILSSLMLKNCKGKAQLCSSVEFDNYCRELSKTCALDMLDATKAHEIQTPRPRDSSFVEVLNMFWCWVATFSCLLPVLSDAGGIPGDQRNLMSPFMVYYEHLVAISLLPKFNVLDGISETDNTLNLNFIHRNIGPMTTASRADLNWDLSSYASENFIQNAQDTIVRYVQNWVSRSKEINLCVTRMAANCKLVESITMELNSTSSLSYVPYTIADVYENTYRYSYSNSTAAHRKNTEEKGIKASGSENKPCRVPFSIVPLLALDNKELSLLLQSYETGDDVITSESGCDCMGGERDYNGYMQYIGALVGSMVTMVLSYCKEPTRKHGILHALVSVGVKQHNMLFVPPRESDLDVYHKLPMQPYIMMSMELCSLLNKTIINSQCLLDELLEKLNFVDVGNVSTATWSNLSVGDVKRLVDVIRIVAGNVMLFCKRFVYMNLLLLQVPQFAAMVPSPGGCIAFSDTAIDMFLNHKLHVLCPQEYYFSIYKYMQKYYANSTVVCQPRSAVNDDIYCCNSPICQATRINNAALMKYLLTAYYNKSSIDQNVDLSSAFRTLTRISADTPHGNSDVINVVNSNSVVYVAALRGYWEVLEVLLEYKYNASKATDLSDTSVYEKIWNYNDSTEDGWVLVHTLLSGAFHEEYSSFSDIVRQECHYGRVYTEDLNNDYADHCPSQSARNCASGGTAGSDKSCRRPWESSRKHRQNCSKMRTKWILQLLKAFTKHENTHDTGPDVVLGSDSLHCWSYVCHRMTCLDLAAKFHMWEVVVTLLRIYFSEKCSFKFTSCISNSNSEGKGTSVIKKNARNCDTFRFLHQAAVHGRVDVFRKCLLACIDMLPGVFLYLSNICPPYIETLLDVVETTLHSSETLKKSSNIAESGVKGSTDDYLLRISLIYRLLFSSRVVSINSPKQSRVHDTFGREENNNADSIATRNPADSSSSGLSMLQRMHQTMNVSTAGNVTKVVAKKVEYKSPSIVSMLASPPGWFTDQFPLVPDMEVKLDGAIGSPNGSVVTHSLLHDAILSIGSNVKCGQKSGAGAEEICLRILRLSVLIFTEMQLHLHVSYGLHVAYSNRGLVHYMCYKGFDTLLKEYLKAVHSTATAFPYLSNEHHSIIGNIQPMESSMADADRTIVNLISATFTIPRGLLRDGSHVGGIIDDLYGSRAGVTPMHIAAVMGGRNSSFSDGKLNRDPLKALPNNALKCFLLLLEYMDHPMYASFRPSTGPPKRPLDEMVLYFKLALFYGLSDSVCYSILCALRRSFGSRELNRRVGAVTGVENTHGNANMSRGQDVNTKEAIYDKEQDCGGNSSNIICKLLYDNNIEYWKYCMSYACRYGLNDTIQCHFTLHDIVPSMMKVCYSHELSIYHYIIKVLYPLAMSCNHGHVCVTLLQYFYHNYSVSKTNPRGTLTVPALIQSMTPVATFRLLMKYMCERNCIVLKKSSNGQKLALNGRDNQTSSKFKRTGTSSSNSSGTKMIVITEKSGKKRIMLVKK